MSEQRDSLFDPDERDAGRSGVALARAVLAGESSAPTDVDPVADREAAIDAIAANSAVWRKDTALPFIRRYLETHPTLFGEDLWKAGLDEPHDRKALGPALREAARHGWMETTGDYRSGSNAQPKHIWRSLICGTAIERGEAEDART